MTLAPQRPHLLHAQKTSRHPRRYVFFDTEARRVKQRGVETQTWRLGCSLQAEWLPRKESFALGAVVRHPSPDDLWSVIGECAHPCTRTVAVAHNLGYDLRIADAFTLLPANGFAIQNLILSPEHVGFDAVRDTETITLIDSHTVLPRSLAFIGKVTGWVKTPLPNDDDDDEIWWQHCEADVELLARAYLSVLTRMRRDDLGGWARTGSGLGWHTLLRKHLEDKVLVHKDDAVRSIELEASYGGRAEAWRWGRITRTTLHEWDYELAYAHIARDYELPARLTGRIERPSIGFLRSRYPRVRFLCHAQVVLGLPVLPTRDAHGIYFPTGSIEGWWWDVELEEAITAGATVDLLEAYCYQALPWLRSWATWVIGAARERGDADSAIFAVAAKHWARAVIGRSAMRYSEWGMRGDAFVPGANYAEVLDWDTGKVGAMAQIAGDRWESWDRTWSDSALPQLWSAVNAHSRVNLWRSMNVAGLEHVLYVDTDALIVDEEGDERLRVATLAGDLGSLRHKQTLHDLEIASHRSLHGQGWRRLAGISRKAVRDDEGVYHSESWERLPAALSAGHFDRVIVRHVEARLQGQDWHRIHCEGGATKPYEAVNGKRTGEGS